MNIVLIGAVDSTRVALECLIEYGTPPSALVTLPLSRSSRHSDFVDLRPLAAEHDVKVIETANVNRPRGAGTAPRAGPGLPDGHRLVADFARRIFCA